MVFGYYVPYEHLDTSYTTECKKDEDWNSIWGSGGKTAKMKAAQECYNKGYYNHTITDCGNWAFKAKKGLLMLIQVNIKIWVIIIFP
jgi:hypothetical protein